jgi:hypothetical protein
MLLNERLLCELQLLLVGLKGLLEELLLCSGDEHLMIAHAGFAISFIVKIELI